jgi:hypothetical protein
MLDNLVVFTAAGFALDRAHYVGDHWLQTDDQATSKHKAGWEGRWACALHVASYTAAGAVALVSLYILGLPTHPAQLVAGLGVSAVTHYFADRRVPLRRLAALLGRSKYISSVTVVRTPGGKPDDCGPGTGLFHLDQSWHYVWIGVAAFVIAL